MAEPTSATETARDFSRRLAQRQASIVERLDEGMQRYAQSLRRYATGEIDGTDLGKDVLNLSVEQAARGVEDVVELGAEYSRWAWSLTGVEMREDSDEDEPEKRAAKKTAKAPARKSAKKATRRRSS